MVCMEGTKAHISFAVFFEFDTPGFHQGNQVNAPLDLLDSLFLYHLSFSSLPAEGLAKAGLLVLSLSNQAPPLVS
jgi:hypothetical protein